MWRFFDGEILVKTLLFSIVLGATWAVVDLVMDWDSYHKWIGFVLVIGYYSVSFWWDRKKFKKKQQS